jgi:hypothetical protein
MKYSLAIIFVVAIFISADGQNSTGMFLTIQCAKKSPRQTVMITNKQICLASNPIILITDFTSLTDVQQLGEKIWFDLTLSTSAIQKLMQISSNLPNSTFALVVEDSVFYVFPASDIQVGRTFRFQGTGKDRSVFAEMQRKLKTAMDLRVN